MEAFTPVSPPALFNLGSPTADVCFLEAPAEFSAPAAFVDAATDEAAAPPSFLPSSADAYFEATLAVATGTPPSDKGSVSLAGLLAADVVFACLLAVSFLVAAAMMSARKVR